MSLGLTLSRQQINIKVCLSLMEFIFFFFLMWSTNKSRVELKHLNN